jgi:hypothetical protein
MRTHVGPKVAATLTTVAVALSVPAFAQAGKGGVPHSTKPCPTHKNKGKHNGAGKGKKKGADRGKKCGHK